MKRRPMVKTVQIALDDERHVALADLKNGILTLLGTWIAYFVVINAFIQQLDKVVVPFVEMPLGVFLVIQGLVLVFLGSVYLLLKHRHA